MINKPKLVKLLVAVLVLVLAAKGAQAIDANWLAPVDGAWNDGANWSSSPAFPKNNEPLFGDRYNATVNAEGTPYVVTLNQNVWVDSLTVDSPDAEVRIVVNGALTTTNGIHVERGTLLLDDGAAIYNTRLSSGAEGSLTSGANRYVRLQDVQLAGVFQAYNYLSLESQLRFDGGLVSFAAGNIHRGTDLTGEGEWRLQSGRPRSFEFQYRIYFYETLGEEMLIGPDVTVRSMGETVSLQLPSHYTPENSGMAVNQGQILAETDGGSLYVSDFRNEGLIRISGGDRFAAGFRGTVGQIDLQPGGNLSVYGAPHFDQQLVVGDQASLYLRAEVQATADTPLQLGPGGQITLASSESFVPIVTTGGDIALNFSGGSPPITATQLSTLPITGPATVSITSQYVGVDLEQGTFDYTTLPANYVFQPGYVFNGTLTGPQTAQNISQRLIDATLDVPLDLTDGFVRLEGVSSLVQPALISGGNLRLGDSWSNLGGIHVAAGELRLDSGGSSTGNIEMTGGTLRITHDTTLTALTSLDFGAPDSIEIGDPFRHDRGTVDLGASTLELNTWSETLWAVAGGGLIENGTIVGTHDGQPLTIRSSGRLANVTIEGVRMSGGSVSDSTIRNIWSDGTLYLSNTTIIDSRVDGGLTGGTIQGTLQFGEYIRGSVLFDAGSTVTGTATLGGSSGRGQRDTFTFVDPNVTLPQGIDLVASTQYDSNALVNAPNTALSVEGNILVGHPTFVRDSWTDSWTFQVGSLHTAGNVTATEDGALIVTGGPWTSAGEIDVTGGELQFDSLHVEATGSLSGWGDAAGNVSIEGVFEAHDQFQFTGDLQLGAAAATVVTLTPLADPAPDEAEPAWISVTGDLEVAGSLGVALSPEFRAQSFTVGDQFRLFEAGAVTGIFTDFTWTETAIDFALVYTADAVLLEVTALNALPGDFNTDGTVDGNDLVNWSDNFGGTTSGADLLAWQQYLGTTFGSSGDLLAIPEATSLALLSYVWLLCNLSSLRRDTCRRSNSNSPRKDCGP